jgi:hypothetical protein
MNGSKFRNLRIASLDAGFSLESRGNPERLSVRYEGNFKNPFVKSPVKLEKFQSMSKTCGGNMDSFMTVKIDSKVPILQAVLLQQQAGAGSLCDILRRSALQMGCLL